MVAIKTKYSKMDENSNGFIIILYFTLLGIGEGNVNSSPKMNKRGRTLKTEQLK